MTITIVVEPQAPGTLNNSASISSSTADPNAENNSALATTSVQECPKLGGAIDDGGLVTGEQWVVCSSPTANGVVGSLTPVLPPSGGHEALMTSGDVSVANPPNDSSGAGRDNGTSARGAFDVSILRLDLSIPAGANCLSFELAFQTEEYPEFVNSAYNDGFIAELDTSDWNVSGSTISAPHNFAFDNGGHIVSVNSSFFDPGQVVVATGTQYDGSTPLLNVQTPVTPGLHSLYLSIFDASDHILDSGAFVDGLKAGHVAEGSCKPGAGRARRAEGGQARRERRRRREVGCRLHPPCQDGRDRRRREPAARRRVGHDLLAPGGRDLHGLRGRGSRVHADVLGRLRLAGQRHRSR